MKTYTLLELIDLGFSLTQINQILKAQKSANELIGLDPKLDTTYLRVLNETLNNGEHISLFCKPFAINIFGKESGE